jgi:hypothetical protein
MNPGLRYLVLAGLTIFAVAACTRSAGGALPTDVPAASSQPPSSSPGDAGGGPDTGIGQPVSPPSSGIPGPGDPGNATIVIAKPGRLAIHQVGASAIEPRVDGQRVTVKLTWWSGVEPCSVLDSVGDVRTGTQIVLTIREGADRLGVACIELAMLKATIVDLGKLDPGTYSIAAYGDIPPVEVVVR